MSKHLVESCMILSIFSLKKRGCFSRGRENKTYYFHWHNGYTGDYVGCIQIAVEFSKDNKDGMYTIIDNAPLKPYKGYFTNTFCNYGGKRYWFICPLSGCNRRIAKLYRPIGAKYFGCRHCYNLSYASMGVSRTLLDKALAKMFKDCG